MEIFIQSDSPEIGDCEIAIEPEPELSKPSNIVNWAENIQLGRNADMLAKMLTDPDSVAKLQELARTGPKSAKAQTLVNSIAGGYIAQKPEITEESK
jgi:hypothetical protein